MATTTSRKTERGRRRWIIGGMIGLVLIGLCVGVGFAAQNFTQAAAQTAAAARWQSAAVVSGPIDAAVNATGSAAAKTEANLQFAATGTVTKIFVAEGDQVTAGQPLAAVDAADSELGVVRAQADLKSAKADYDKLLAGASKEEIAQAQAQVDQARGSYTQTTGSVTKADITAAQAKLTAARASLAQLQAGPKSEVLRNSEAAVQQAENALTTQRDSLSLAKTNAKLALDRAVNSLTQAQSNYAAAKSNWQSILDSGNDPVNPSTVGADGKPKDNKLNDAQRQQYYNTLVQAEATLRSAETTVQQSQIDYENARQSEVNGVQNAESQLAKVQADLAETQGGAKADELASARAQVQSAQAELDRLTGANRSGSLAASQAGVASAEAALAKLTASPAPNQLAVSEAAVERADAALKQAQHTLGQATLTAPFAGTITKINARVGEPATSAATDGAISMADLSAYHINLPIDELDVAQVQPGQPARVTFDAAPEKVGKGKVANIAPIATKNQQGTTTYQVRVDLDASEVRVMPGMTASVDIVTSQKDDAVLVPRRAIQTENGKNFVWVPTTGKADASGRPASERRDVTLGLSNADSVEVTNGLKAGDKVLVADTTTTLNPLGGGN